ncbi:MAG: tetratricopeptide repeat protein [Phycisphaeraceae bacterium]
MVTRHRQTEDAPLDETPRSMRLRAEAGASRLAQLSRACLTDQQTAAELELTDWQRQPDAPAEITLLLAGLLCRRGELDHAIDLLSEAWSACEESDPRVIECLIAALHLEGNEAAANDLTVMLRRQFTGDPHVDAFLHLMRMSARSSDVNLDDPIVDSVAADLLRQPEVIASLVAAQKISHSLREIALLRSALGRAFGDIELAREQLTACIAMADLALMAGDNDDARRWAHRGLRIDPYSAPLALTLARFADDADFGPSTMTVLNEAVRAHPKYPDLRAALIRRDFAQGRVEAARDRLTAWLRREPNQPLALGLEKELAA